MILIEDTVISDDIKEKEFVCNLSKCKGACCVEGDLGAPLEDVELPILKEAYPLIKKYLDPRGIAAIEEQGEYVMDEDDEYSTPTIDGRECAYAVYDKTGTLKCGIEDAYNDGVIDFKKPISCHLYPIRITKYEHYHALNYDQWSICSDACTLGEELKVPVYKFLKDPLIRAYGEDWYKQLEDEIEGE
ncbi:DUF3109 family protein [Jiulongibacter sp. NS-SX5]|uniref:DUF3109 family protein n=1 Tax=Jiulongibacter sp. NS-SX5 TaxID=3463854 RepID=UPI004059868B